jgi:hypothetical protein
VLPETDFRRDAVLQFLLLHGSFVFQPFVGLLFPGGKSLRSGFLSLEVPL